MIKISRFTVKKTKLSQLMDRRSDILIYETLDHHTQVEVTFDNDTVWLTQSQIVDLFQSSKANISEHIKHIFEEEELLRDQTVRKFRTVRTEESIS